MREARESLGAALHDMVRNGCVYMHADDNIDLIQSCLDYKAILPVISISSLSSRASLLRAEDDEAAAEVELALPLLGWR